MQKWTLSYNVMQQVYSRISMLKHLWDHGNLLETWVVRATELIMVPGKEANGDNLGKFFDLLYKNGMLSVLIRIASMRQF